MVDIKQVRIKSISIQDSNAYYNDLEKYPVQLKGDIRMKLDGTEHEISVKLTNEQGAAIVQLCAEAIAATVQSAALSLMQQVDPVGHAALLNRMNDAHMIEHTPEPQIVDADDVYPSPEPIEADEETVAAYDTKDEPVRSTDDEIQY